MHRRQPQRVAPGLARPAEKDVLHVHVRLRPHEASGQHVRGERLHVEGAHRPGEEGARRVGVRVGAVGVAPHQVPGQQAIALQRPHPQRHRGRVAAQLQGTHPLPPVREAVPVFPPHEARALTAAPQPQPHRGAHVDAELRAAVEDENRPSEQRR